MGGAERRTAAVSLQGAASKLLFELQVEQHHHDEVYHREIARLSLHQRLNHMALHFAKYTGKVAGGADGVTVLRAFTDTLVIALSTANILNLDLWQVIKPDGREFIGLASFGRSVATETNCCADGGLMLRSMATASGRMAAACEKIDHLEDISFRSEITAAVAQLARISLAYLAFAGVDPASAVRERLGEVKLRLKLHGRA